MSTRGIEMEELDREEMEELDREALIETARDNTRQLAQEIASHSSIESFLQDDLVRLNIRPTNATKLEQATLLEYKYDIDGVVVELNNLSALSSPINYIRFNPCKGSMQPAYHLLKKHVNLQYYSANGLKRLMNVHALHLCYPREWRISVCVLPNPGYNASDFSSKAQALTTTLSFFQRVKTHFVNIITSLPKDDNNRPTIQKNSMHDISNYNVLHQDQPFILSCFDRALQMSCIDPSKMMKIIATQFGQKSNVPLRLSDYFDTTSIGETSVHHAVTISASDYNTHLLWSRQGIQELINDRGTVFSALSFYEAVNFQTNIDNRRIDISGELRNVSKYPAQITFLQMYADTPHCRTDHVRPHPVSGLIACCKLLHPSTTRAMQRNAVNYMQSMRENEIKLLRDIPCRLEIVTRLFPHQVPQSIEALDLFDEEVLMSICENKPLFVPFHDCNSEDDNHSFTKIMKRLASYVNDTLSTLHEQSQHRGGYMASWKAYQMELCAEKLFWGRPMVPNDNIISINLGPGAIYDQRSVTNIRGILGISPANSSSLPDRPPPLNHWTHSRIQQERVNRLFAFSDSLHAGDVVIGRSLLMILFGDLYNSDVFSIESFTRDHPVPPMQCSGSISLEQLAHELIIRSRFPFPFAFGRALEMLSISSIDALRVIKAGVVELKLTHFPALQFRDESNHQRAQWNRKAAWQIIFPGGKESTSAKAASLSADVLVNLETRKLTFARNLAVFKDTGMPWMVPVVSRLAHLDLDRRQMTDICVFVSGAALIQQSIYVDYNKLSYLELDLALPQKRLQSLEILSNSLIAGINRMKVYRLHERIPYKVPKPQPLVNPRSSVRQTSAAGVPEAPEENINPSEDYDEVGVQQDVTVMEIRNLPANYRRPWSTRELELLQASNHAAKGSQILAYKEYVRMCTENRIPTRSWNAFEHKSRRL
ncbi:uncharacterized protein LOC135155775 [Lytechinus pictus]|uniref:uncharacterized protein LOC135155775 n=1 Tax=Lytechinus pictus TaxID=7653 RepID=UPI0030B9E0E6